MTERDPRKLQEPRWKGALLYWATVVSVLAGLVVFIYTAVGWLTDLVGITAAEDTGVPRLEVKQATPVNRPDVYKNDRAGPLQTRPSTPQIAAAIKNHGEQSALIERVVVKIEDSARLPICPYIGPAGPGRGYPNSYPIKLPLFPTPEETTIRHEVQREVPAGKIDKFTIFFRAPTDFASAHLYAVHVAVVVDGADRPLEIGRFVIGVPGPVPGSGFYLPEREDGLADTFETEKAHGGTLALITTWCYRRNVAELRRLLAAPGRRAPALAALAEFRPAANWPLVGDRRPARAAIEPLLANSFALAPLLAVFAAEQTEDQRLVERTRRRAAARLAHWAEVEIAGGGSGITALANARAARLLVSSPATRSLVREVETRQLAAEEAAVGD